MIASMAPAGSIERAWIDVQEWGLARLTALTAARRQRLGTAGPAHLAIGLAGERAALFELRRRGYLVVAERWQSRRARGDIDLIAWLDDVLCFVEVKTRSVRDNTPAESAVDDDKRQQIKTLARLYGKALPEKERAQVQRRFLVVAVYLLPSGTEFEFIEGSFGWD